MNQSMTALAPGIKNGGSTTADDKDGAKTEDVKVSGLQLLSIP